MKTNIRMSLFSKLIRAVSAALILSLMVSFCGFSGKCTQIRERVLRLHVIANSDNKQDQHLKLKVRDTVIETAANLFDTAKNEKEAAEQAGLRMAEIQAAAQQRVYDEGYDYSVKAELCEMYFTTRRYENITLPAGMYEAVRIRIGEGKGKNWWCVVFPPICLSAASEAAEISDVLEPEQEEIVTQPQKYEVRFKIVEVFEDIKGKLNTWFS
ncbi:MAG: stage II sporulation protein R [Oscillospiraceae bacterium]|nr:stage II sporulation protein R [Oscillospiraceae bacterium]MDD3833602.1 stage II sporulation protein R [Oscillospiraceae bacterium]MDD4546303.1 stage II sporulation protein R [Oscillospiraceae bacterium]